jgi:hypothetical protein
MTRLELAIFELNRKFVAITTAKMNVGMSEDDAMTFALNDLQKEIEKVNHIFNVHVRFDNNYSFTLGIYPYGVYQSLDEMSDIEKIVDGGY